MSALQIALTIAISVMCGVIIFVSLLLAALDLRTRIQMKATSKNIVLASVTFDDSGKILVKPDGTIPMQIMQTDAESEVRSTPKKLTPGCCSSARPSIRLFPVALSNVILLESSRSSRPTNHKHSLHTRHFLPITLCTSYSPPCPLP